MANTFDLHKSFSISYDTDETKQHSIDAETLGNSLVSLARVIRQSDKILNGENSQVKVEVKAHTEGTFTVDLVAWYQSGGADVLNTLGLTVASFSAGAGTVFGAIKQIRSKKITAKVRQGDKKTHLILSDGSSIECTDEVADIVADRYVRQELENVIRNPVANEDGAKFVLKDENKNIVDFLDSEDAISFGALPRTALIEVEHVENTMTVVFTQVNFNGTQGWKCDLPDGRNVSVSMKHKAFRESVNKGYESFVKGEPYIVRLVEKITVRPNTEPTVSYYIKEVVSRKKK